MTAAPHCQIACTPHELCPSLTACCAALRCVAACRQTASATLTLSETAVRLRGVLSELSNVDKTLTNSGISYASEEQGGDITERDLPPLQAEAVRPSHRQVAALRSYCQDMMLRCEEGKEKETRKAHREEKVEETPGFSRGVDDDDDDLKEEKADTAPAAPSTAAPLALSPMSSASVSADDRSAAPSLSSTLSLPSPMGADEEKAVVGATVAAALASEPARNTAEGAKVAAQENEQRAMNQKLAHAGAAGGRRPSSNSQDVLAISRWGELLREPRKPLTREQLKKKQTIMERDEEREIKCQTRSSDHSTATPHCSVATPLCSHLSSPLFLVSVRCGSQGTLAAQHSASQALVDVRHSGCSHSAVVLCPSRVIFAQDQDAERVCMRLQTVTPLACVRDGERVSPSLSLLWLLACSWDRYARNKKDKLKSRIRKGIPDSLRSAVWPRFTGAVEAMKAAPPGTYRKMLSEHCELADVISRDIARTFPNHLLFRDELGSSGGDGEDVSGSSSGRQSLYNVLKAYANYDKQTGYCQGMGFVVGLFLMYLSEEEAFWMLERVMRSDKFMMHGLYAVGMPLLFQYFYQFDQLLFAVCPRLHEHLDMNGIAPSLYATQWFLTVFAYNMPFELVLRIWDVFLSEGPKIPFRFALSFMQHFDLQIRQGDLEHIITTLKDIHHDPAMEDTDAVVERAMKVRLTGRQLSELAHEYDQQQLHNKRQQMTQQKK